MKLFPTAQTEIIASPSPAPKLVPTVTSAATTSPTPNPYIITAKNVDELTFLTRFSDYDKHLSWSPDGMIIAVSDFQIIDFYDTTNFGLLGSINKKDFLAQLTLDEEDYLPPNKIPNGPFFNPESVTFSPDGKTIALTLHGILGKIIFIDTTTYDVVSILSVNAERITKIQFSQDGKLIAGNARVKTGEDDSSWNLYLWDANTGETKYILKKDMETDDFTFSPDGTMIIAGDRDPLIYIWNTQTGKLLTSLTGLSSASSVAFSPDNLYAAAGDNDHTAMIWNLSGEAIAKYETDTIDARINSIAFNATGDLLTIADHHGQILIFDIESGKLLKEFDTEYTNMEISFSPDSHILSVTTDLYGIAFWKTKSEILLNPMPTQIPDQEILNNYASLPSGKYILYTDRIGMKAISEDGSYQHEISTSLRGIPTSVDGRILIKYNSSYSNDYSGYINLLTGETNSYEHLGTLSPNLDWIAEEDFCNPNVYAQGIEGFSTIDETHFCVSVEDMKWIETEHVGEVRTKVTWSPDARWLAFTKVSYDRRENPDPDWSVLPSNGLFIMDTSCFQDPQTCDQKTKQVIHFPYKIYGQSIYDFYTSWSPDGTFFVLNEGSIFIVSDLRTNSVWKIEKTPKDTEGYQYFGISPDNQWIAYSSDWTNIVLQPLNGGSAIEIANGMENIEVLGWITAPLLKVDKFFVVLPAGNHVRIRENPYLDAAELDTLYTGNTFTVLDGPVQADGYTWWYVHSDVDGTEGWISEFYGWYELIE